MVLLSAPAVSPATGGANNGTSRLLTAKQNRSCLSHSATLTVLLTATRCHSHATNSPARAPARPPPTHDQHARRESCRHAASAARAAVSTSHQDGPNRA